MPIPFTSVIYSLLTLSSDARAIAAPQKKEAPNHSLGLSPVRIGSQLSSAAASRMPHCEFLRNVLVPRTQSLRLFRVSRYFSPFSSTTSTFQLFFSQSICASLLLHSSTFDIAISWLSHLQKKSTRLIARLPLLFNFSRNESS